MWHLFSLRGSKWYRVFLEQLKKNLLLTKNNVFNVIESLIPNLIFIFATDIRI